MIPMMLPPWLPPKFPPILLLVTTPYLRMNRLSPILANARMIRPPKRLSRKRAKRSPPLSLNSTRSNSPDGRGVITRIIRWPLWLNPLRRFKSAARLRVGVLVVGDTAGRWLSPVARCWRRRWRLPGRGGRLGGWTPLWAALADWWAVGWGDLGSLLHGDRLREPS